MSRSLRRGAAAAIVLAAIVPLAACSASNDAETLQIKPDNAATSIGADLTLNNIVVVTPAGAAGEYSGAATVTVNISNSGSAPETLKSLKVGDAAATFTGPKGDAVSEIVIPAGGSVLVSGRENSPIAQVSSAKLTVGGYAPTSFTFGRAGQVSTQANVQPGAGVYAGYGPKAESKASASPSGSASPSASASASASPGATASGSPAAPPSTSASASASAH
ncbi:DUF461 domain-containing protein [Kitasatospora sp. NPDC049285]|uniref:DUF461 domain-containing protein n=1 Tax=Kitasatospora sp. NPDC049285 TaxID=3157096 RepID=UPI003441F6C2